MAISVACASGRSAVKVMELGRIDRELDRRSTSAPYCKETIALRCWAPCPSVVAEAFQDAR
jgi:thiamine pyrophosphate-dependent acetolactate synthase large subunit-like protein